ncbi:MAG TPA: ABC transporter ATP-binding protein [Candidatus Acidoferrales bacterium]|nr:ABC transporter ATP-binding protein [Candidatus Acidoferrales bacterium]
MENHPSLGNNSVTEPAAQYFPAAGGPSELLRVEGLRKTFRSGSTEVTPFADVNFTIARGEMTAIVGPSGAGKSTLLHMLAALDTPSSGAIYFERNSLEAFVEPEIADYRNRAVGFVWQRHHLLPDFSAAENVAMPLMIGGARREAALRTAGEWLGRVGLGGRDHQAAGELSGGEQQRVAIARALVNAPKLLLADEPTGDLDERNAELIFDLMEQLHESCRLTSVLATHNLSLARRADRVLQFGHGKLVPAAEISDSRQFTGAETAGTGATAPGERG